MKIYVVSASQGEYSDREEWVVKAFEDETAAKAFVEDATTRTRAAEAKLMTRGKYTHGKPQEYGVADLFTGEYPTVVAGSPTSFFMAACEFVPLSPEPRVEERDAD